MKKNRCIKDDYTPCLSDQNISRLLFKTDNDYMGSVKRDWRNFAYVPDEAKTYEMCLYMVQCGLTTIKEIPEQMRTKELCLYDLYAALKNGPFIFKKHDNPPLEKLPDEPLSRELCHEAVANDPKAIGFVPPEYLDTQFCFDVMKRGGNFTAIDFKPPPRDCYLDLTLVPDNVKTYELYLKIVSYSGHRLKDVPKNMVNLELCFAAFGIVYSNLQNENKKIDADIRRPGQSSRDTCLKYVPKKLRTQELCLAAVQYNSDNMQYVPDKIRTLEMCTLAVTRYTRRRTYHNYSFEGGGYNLRYIPKELMTPELLKAAIQSGGKYMQYIPKELITPELLLIAVEADSCG